MGQGKKRRKKRGKKRRSINIPPRHGMTDQSLLIIDDPVKLNIKESVEDKELRLGRMRLYYIIQFNLRGKIRYE